MFVEITRGRSFRGLARYCLHDVDARTDERVEFVQTRNLATDNPEAAWRVMAARHFLQDELKERAGVGKGGRKDGKPVGHLVLGWRSDEAEAQHLDPEQMQQAAAGALKAIGAEDYPALVIGHSDTQHPHCHVVLCLIGDDGRLKKNWKEREQLSRFALEYEIAHHGEPIVKRREENWLHREAGETPAPMKKLPRHLYELRKAAQHDEQVRAFYEQHRTDLAALERAKAERQEQAAANRKRLKQIRDERLKQAAETAQAERAETLTHIRKAHRPDWQELLRRQEADRHEFERRETSLKGSIRNALAMIDWRKLIGSRREDQPNQLSQAFRLLTSEAVRWEELQQRQQTEQERLRGRQRETEEDAVKRIRREERGRLEQIKAEYVRKAERMRERQLTRRQELREQQKMLTAQRTRIMQQYRQRQVEQERKEALERGAGSEPTRRVRRERKPRLPRKDRTRPQDVTVQGTATEVEAAQLIDQEKQRAFEQRMREQLHQRRSRKRDRDDREH